MTSPNYAILFIVGGITFASILSIVLYEVLMAW